MTHPDRLGHRPQATPQWKETRREHENQARRSRRSCHRPHDGAERLWIELDSGSDSKGGGTIASQMIFGGPPEFKTRPDGIPGLEKNYGVEFGKYTVTDVGGPVTVNALKRGQVDAVDLFTTDPSIEANDFVILEDPKSNFAAQNVVPLVTKSKATDGVKQVLNGIQAKLTTENLGGLLGQVVNDKADPADVAKGFLTENGLDATGTSAKGESLSVGSANFPENVILAEIYAQALEAQGATIEKKLNIGARPKYWESLEAGLHRPLPGVHRLDPGVPRPGVHGDQPGRRLRRAGQDAAEQPGGPGQGRGAGQRRHRGHQGDGREVRPEDDRRPGQEGLTRGDSETRTGPSGPVRVGVRTGCCHPSSGR